MTVPEQGMVFRHKKEGFVIKIEEKRGIHTKIRSSSGFTDNWSYQTLMSALNSPDTEIIERSDCDKCGNPTWDESTGLCREHFSKEIGSEQEVNIY